MPLESRPGEVFHYGGQHMHVAAGVAEAVTGQRFVDIFQAQIARPLGMTHTRFRGGAIFAPNASDDHPAPAGSAESTLGDYGRFLEMISHDGVAPDGTRILASATVAEMQTSQIDDVRNYRGPSYRMKEHNPYGLGEWLDWAGEDNEAIVLSSDGAFGFRPWIDKQNDIVGVYLIQDTGAGVVEGDPRDTPDASNVPTSGPWVFEDVARALGGSLPADKTPAS
jgi:CubicO group peptidase (beta-lactamase class C family)